MNGEGPSDVICKHCTLKNNKIKCITHRMQEHLWLWEIHITQKYFNYVQVDLG
jgi:hypothetical protein